MKKILLLLIIALAVSFNSFAGEEEEAQTRPNPMKHQSMVSKGKCNMKAQAGPKNTEGKLFSEEEEAQTRPNPVMLNSVNVKIINGAPKTSTGKLSVPDEEEEETGMVAPATTF